MRHETWGTVPASHPKRLGKRACGAQVRLVTVPTSRGAGEGGQADEVAIHTDTEREQGAG